jgi:BirA family biotin operon repressor/biotin-[acetyl-CoA-carboxylase] ligase
MNAGSFAAAEFEALRRAFGIRLGSPLTTLALTTSTNDLALTAARNGAPHGTTFVADQQTSGRGRRGRHWLSSSGEGLLVSVVLRLELEPARLGLVPLAAGLAVRAAVAELLPAELESSTRVKWPNDVWVNRKKIAGVLAESRLGGDNGAVVVLGVGVNVGVTELPPELSTSAISLSLLGASCSRERVLAGMFDCLELRLARLCHDPDEIVSELRQYDGLLGGRVRADGTEGIASGIDREGRLLLRLATGEIAELQSGSVELLD